jgi:hypothetical protein
MIGRAVVVCLSLVLLPSSPSTAERPFFTEEAETLQPGYFTWDFGLGLRDQARDFGIEDRETQIELGATRLSFGLGSIVEMQLTGVPVLLIDSGESTGSNAGDWIIGTKVRMLNGNRGSLSFLGEVKLPSGSDEKGGATDETDFWAFLLFSSGDRRNILHANIGLGILGNPATTAAQNDVLLLRLAWELAASSKDLFGVEGLLQSGPADHDDGGMIRIVYSRKMGGWAVFGGLGVGLNDDADNGRIDIGFRRRFRLGKIEDRDHRRSW